MGFSRHSVEMELRASPVQILEISFQRLLAHTKSLLQSSKAAENHWRCVKVSSWMKNMKLSLEKDLLFST